jgi:hypothetical protein
MSNIHVIQESSLYRNHIVKHIGHIGIFILNRQSHRFRLRNRIHKSNIHYIIEHETLSNIHVSNETVTILSMYNTCPGPHC